MYGFCSCFDVVVFCCCCLSVCFCVVGGFLEEVCVCLFSFKKNESRTEYLWKRTSLNSYTSASAHHTQSPRLSCLDKEVSFQRSSERLNGVLDALGEDSPKGGSDIPLGLLVVPLGFLIPGPENTKERFRW